MSRKRKLKRDDREAQIIATVCEMLEPWDSQIDHPWRLSDCLLLKFNLINKRQVRHNVRVGPPPEGAPPA